MNLHLSAGCLSSSHPPSSQPWFGSTCQPVFWLAQSFVLPCSQHIFYLLPAGSIPWSSSLYCCANSCGSKCKSWEKPARRGETPKLPKLWLLVNKCSQCHSLCRLSVCPGSVESFCLVPGAFKYILFTHHLCKKYCNSQFTAVEPNCNDYFKNIFQTDLNCECLRCFPNELLIDLDAFEIISLKKQERCGF